VLRRQAPGRAYRSTRWPLSAAGLLAIGVQPCGRTAGAAPASGTAKLSGSISQRRLGRPGAGHAGRAARRTETGHRGHRGRRLHSAAAGPRSASLIPRQDDRRRRTARRHRQQKANAVSCRSRRLQTGPKKAGGPHHGSRRTSRKKGLPPRLPAPACSRGGAPACDPRDRNTPFPADRRLPPSSAQGLHTPPSAGQPQEPVSGGRGQRARRSPSALRAACSVRRARQPTDRTRHPRRCGPPPPARFSRVRPMCRLPIQP